MEHFNSILVHNSRPASKKHTNQSISFFQWRVKRFPWRFILINRDLREFEAKLKIRKHLNNSCLHNITPAIFYTCILAEQPTSQKAIKCLHFVQIYCLSKISTSSIANHQHARKSLFKCKKIRNVLRENFHIYNS